MNIYDIARMAGVSPATVSRVINNNPKVGEDRRRRVLDALEQAKYTPNQAARNLAGQSSKTVAILCVDIRHVNYSNIAYEVERQASSMGYNVFLCNTTLDPVQQLHSLRMMASKRVDCLILIGSSLSNATVHDELDATFAETPVITLNNEYHGPQAYGVFGRIADGVVQAVKYLHSLGHERIVFVNDGDTWISRQKDATFRATMAEYGLPTVAHSVCSIPSGFDSGGEAVRYFDSHGVRFTAVMGCDDVTALGIIRTLRQTGRSVPEDVSVIGYFNTIHSRMCEPALTTVDNDIASITKGICHALHGALTKKGAPKSTFIDPMLIVRNSTAKPTMNKER